MSSRYIIRFEKHGWIRYTSHLDMLRLFKRSFKRIGIRLEHSQGFNPHPKMNFAQPLSLGYESVGDYLEFDTEDQPKPEDILTGLNSVLPEGIWASACIEVEKTKKSLAGVIAAGRYRIRILHELPQEINVTNVIETLMAQTEILVEKRQKKTKKYVETNIRPLLLSMKPEVVDDNNILLNILVRCGSEGNLNPELLGQAFCKAAGIQYKKELLRIERLELYGPEEDGRFTSVMEIFSK